MICLSASSVYAYKETVVALCKPEICTSISLVWRRKLMLNLDLLELGDRRCGVLDFHICTNIELLSFHSQSRQSDIRRTVNLLHVG